MRCKGTQKTSITETFGATFRINLLTRVRSCWASPNRNRNNRRAWCAESFFNTKLTNLSNAIECDYFFPPRIIRMQAEWAPFIAFERFERFVFKIIGCYIEGVAGQAPIEIEMTGTHRTRSFLNTNLTNLSNAIECDYFFSSRIIRMLTEYAGLHSIRTIR